VRRHRIVVVVQARLPRGIALGAAALGLVRGGLAGLAAGRRLPVALLGLAALAGLVLLALVGLVRLTLLGLLLRIAFLLAVAIGHRGLLSSTACCRRTESATAMPVRRAAAGVTSPCAASIPGSSRPRTPAGRAARRARHRAPRSSRPRP